MYPYTMGYAETNEDLFTTTPTFAPRGPATYWTQPLTARTPLHTHVHMWGSAKAQTYASWTTPSTQMTLSQGQRMAIPHHTSKGWVYGRTYKMIHKYRKNYVLLNAQKSSSIIHIDAHLMRVIALLKTSFISCAYRIILGQSTPSVA